MRLSFLVELCDTEGTPRHQHWWSRPAHYLAKSSSGPHRLLGLYAHSGQTDGTQTLQCQVMGTAAMGIGCRIADVLSAGALQLRAASFFNIQGRYLVARFFRWTWESVRVSRRV